MSASNKVKAFPFEGNFMRCVENANAYLDSMIDGSEYRPPNPEVLSPFPVEAVVEELINKYVMNSPTDHFGRRNRAENLYGTVYVVLKNRWYNHYKALERTVSDRHLPSSPPSMKGGDYANR